MKLPLAFSLLLLYYLGGCQAPDKSIAESDAAVHFSADFEGGSLGTVRQLSENHWACAVAGESDDQNRNRQASWYYFKLSGAKAREITIDLTALLGEYNYKAGAHAITANTRPFISSDGQAWRPLSDEEVQWDESNTELRMFLQPKSDTIWIAHQPPYTYSRLEEFVDSLAGHPHLSTDTIGSSVEGRPLLLLNISKAQVPVEKKKVIWLMARQHAWEAGTSWVMEGALRYLLQHPDSQSLLEEFTFKIFPLADPDGVVRGGVRFNRHGHDLNRNWDLVKKEEMPEIYAQKQAILHWLNSGQKINIFLTLHNTEAVDYVQGPNLEAGHKLWQHMLDHTSFHAPEGLRPIPESTTPGRMTVHQALWAEQKIPAYLMELKVEALDTSGNRRSIKEWLALGPEVIKAMVAAVK
jgi:hypothetical protein